MEQFIKKGYTKSVGYVGSPGYATGPHFDFRVWQNGQAVNPLKLQIRL